jgi:hypothetical protein
MLLRPIQELAPVPRVVITVFIVPWPVSIAATKVCDVGVVQVARLGKRCKNFGNLVASYGSFRT